MDEDTIKMYSLSTCSHCKATKKFLGECGVKYENSLTWICLTEMNGQPSLRM
jgi:arsenate reductase-like glutaredoxin family protein